MSRWPMVMASLPRSAWRSRASCHAVMAAARAGRALRAASAVPSISARCMRSAVRGMCQSEGADAVAARRARVRDVPSAGPKPLSRRMSRRKAASTNASNGWRGRQTSRPSTVRQARKGTASAPRNRESHDAETRSSSAEHTTDIRFVAARRWRGGEIAHLRPHPPQTMRRGHQQFVALRRRGEMVSPRPRRGTAERIIQQRGVGIDQRPVLPAPDDRCQEAKHAAGACAKIHQARAPGQPIRKPPCQSNAARGEIERFAQRQPIGGEPLRHSASASSEFPYLRLPARQRLPDLPRGLRHLAAQGRAEDHPPQRLRQVVVIADREHHAGLGVTRLPAAPPALTATGTPRFNASAITMP